MAKGGVGGGVNIKSNGTQNKTTKQNKNKIDSEAGEGGGRTNQLTEHANFQRDTNPNYTLATKGP